MFLLNLDLAFELTSQSESSNLRRPFRYLRCSKDSSVIPGQYLKFRHSRVETAYFRDGVVVRRAVARKTRKIEETHSLISSTLHDQSSAPIPRVITF